MVSLLKGIEVYHFIFIDSIGYAQARLYSSKTLVINIKSKMNHKPSEINMYLKRED